MSGAANACQIRRPTYIKTATCEVKCKRPDECSDIDVAVRTKTLRIGTSFGYRRKYR